MTLTTLILLGATALVSLPRPGRLMPSVRIHMWIQPLVTVILLAGAAVTATRTTPVHGFALAVALVLSTVTAAMGAGPLVPAVFNIARRQADSSPGPEPEPLHGGRIIGILERIAVAASILAGWPEGVAVVLAVKGLARYPELRDPGASEQFIIGTFTSVLWAVAVCGIGQAVIT